jgi:hypothetical protein
MMDAHILTSHALGIAQLAIIGLVDKWYEFSFVLNATYFVVLFPVPSGMISSSLLQCLSRYEELLAHMVQ